MARSRTKSEGALVQSTRELLGQSAPDAVAVLVALMHDTAQKPELRMKAAESILDRVCGKSAGSAQGGSQEIPDHVCFEGVLEEWSQ